MAVSSRNPRWGLLVAVVVLALTIPGVWARSTYGAQVSVDEPQYLLTALSLAEDFDLDISDEIADERYRAFHLPPLDPQTFPVDDGGRQFSPHDPLLPLVLAPAMGLGGWWAARLTLALVAAATAAGVFLVATGRAGVGPGTACLVTVVLFAALPLAPYATQIYPEMAAAGLAIAGFGALLTPAYTSARSSRPEPLTGTELMLALAAIGLLPWLAVKYVPVAGVLALVLLWRRWQTSGLASSLVVGAGLVVWGGLYLLVHQRIYGGWTVYASGDHFVDSGEFSVVGESPDYLGRSERLVNLLVDQRFGLAPWTPLWLAAPAALAWASVRWRSFLSVGLPVVGAGYGTAVFAALTMHGWWSPGRQVVVVLPVVVVAVAKLVDDLPRAKWAVALAGLVGVVNWLVMVWEATSGRRTIVVDFWETSSVFYRTFSQAFPDVARSSGSLRWQLGWSVVLLATTAVAGLAARRHSNGDRLDTRS